MLVFDCETDGLLNEMTKVHCLHIFNTVTGVMFRYDKHNVIKGVRQLEKAEAIVGHNIISFDIPALKKIFKFKPQGKVYDTLPWARLLYPEIKFMDMQRAAKGTLPNTLIGSHKLEAWGYRLGDYKGDFGKATDWKEWSQEMSDYCVQDVMVTVKLYEMLSGRPCSGEALQLEFDVTRILARQIAFGFKFNEKKAKSLYANLCQEKQDIKLQMLEIFPPRIVKDKEFTPKVNSKKFGYIAGVPFTKIKLEEFNPASRPQIASRLIKQYGWNPVHFTEGGKPQVDESILSKLPWPEAQVLARYFMLNKRTGQIAEGDEEKAWLQAVTNGRIHGYVNPQGAITRRMTHAFPNLAQVPNANAPYGPECRELFEVAPGHVLLGCDAKGLELRCLAHYMAIYDGGAYAEIVLNGDIHTANQHAAGLATRDAAKTFIYAFLYGCGDLLLGQMLTEGDGKQYSERAYRKIGRAVRDKFMAGLPALNSLIKRVKAKVEAGEQLKALDGHPLKCRSSHSALNLLLQSAGAIVMKKALVILDEDFQDEGYVPGIDYEFVVNVHDEFQIEVFNPENAEKFGNMANAAITQAGEHFKFRCRLDGDFKVGLNWKETH